VLGLTLETDMAMAREYPEVGVDMKAVEAQQEADRQAALKEREDVQLKGRRPPPDNRITQQAQPADQNGRQKN